MFYINGWMLWLTLIASRAVLLSSPTGVAFFRFKAILVEDTVILGLLQCVVLAESVVAATLDAVLQVPSLQNVGVYKMPLTFLGAMTFSCWAAARRRLKGKCGQNRINYVFSQLLSTDAIGTGSSVGVTGFCAVSIEDAQCVGWLPSPPLTVLRGHVHMTSAKFPEFLTPSLPLSIFIHFSITPSPLVDIILPRKTPPPSDQEICICSIYMQ